MERIFFIYLNDEFQCPKVSLTKYLSTVYGISNLNNMLVSYDNIYKDIRNNAIKTNHIQQVLQKKFTLKSRK